MKHLNITLTDEDYEHLTEVKKGYGLNWHDLLMSVARNISFGEAEDSGFSITTPTETTLGKSMHPSAEPEKVLEDAMKQMAHAQVNDRPVITRQLKTKQVPDGISETDCPKCGTTLEDDMQEPDDEHETDHRVLICYTCGYQRNIN